MLINAGVEAGLGFIRTMGVDIRKCDVDIRTSGGDISTLRTGFRTMKGYIRKSILY